MPIHLSSSPLKLLRADTSGVYTKYRQERDKERSLQGGLAALSQAATQIGNIGEQYREQERLNYVNKSKIAFSVAADQAYGEWEQGLSGENAMESVATLKQRLSDIGTKILENAPDDQSRDVAGMQMLMAASHMQREAGKKAHQVHQSYSIDLVDQALNDARKSAYHSGMGGGGPADLTGYLDAVDTTMDAQAKAGYILDPLSAEKVKRKAKSDIAKGFVKGGLDSDNDSTVLRTVGDLQGGRYNSLDFNDLLVIGHSAAAAKDRIKAKREAEAKRAAAGAEESMAAKVYATALSITSKGQTQDPGAAAELLYSPTAKDLFKGVSDKVLGQAARWARSSWEIQRGREAEQQKDLADSATDVFEDLRRKGELTHDKIESDPAVPVSVRKSYHDILDKDADRLATNTAKQDSATSKSMAASLLSKVASGDITRVSEIAPYRAQGLQDDEYNTVVKSLGNAKESRNKPWMAMADDYLKTVTKSKSNDQGVLDPADVVRVHSILQDELSSGKIEAKDILKRTQELTDVAYTGRFWTFGDRDVRGFEVAPDGQLPATKEGQDKRQEALDIIRKNDPTLYSRLYGSGAQSGAAPAQPRQAVDQGAADAVPEAAKALIQNELKKAGKATLANNPEAIRKVYEANKDKFKGLDQ